jgi:hypothetical protein
MLYSLEQWLLVSAGQRYTEGQDSESGLRYARCPLGGTAGFLGFGLATSVRGADKVLLFCLVESCHGAREAMDVQGRPQFWDS